jgi:sialic acid synthase SpsE
MKFLERDITGNNPPFIVAELSCSHEGDIEKAALLVSLAKAAGANAVKIQLYDADEMTLDYSSDDFVIKDGPWKGRTLHGLYAKTGTSRDMAVKLFNVGHTLGIPIFASVFSATGVEFLEGLRCPAYKIASFEITDVNLIRRAAKTTRPVVISTGMASYNEISEAYENVHPSNVILMHCVSSYPTDYHETNLWHIPRLGNLFHCPVGFSDHSIDLVCGQFAVVAGARVLEKHIMLPGSQSEDKTFSLTPPQFTQYTKLAKLAAICTYKVDVPGEEHSKQFRRSLYATADIAAGSAFTAANIRAVRPSYGLPCRDYGRLLYKRAATDIKAGTALTKEHIG